MNSDCIGELRITIARPWNTSRKPQKASKKDNRHITGNQQATMTTDQHVVSTLCHCVFSQELAHICPCLQVLIDETVLARTALSAAMNGSDVSCIADAVLMAALTTPSR